ncbi:hypothetical protein LCGC14_2201260 [marine sediment metagenome]|uniref:Uncharacterized protein n=1 Tax=marine sediment metagenome TaxID=412755 RepID=A0A0F9GCI6_9ZZZZ
MSDLGFAFMFSLVLLLGLIAVAIYPYKTNDARQVALTLSRQLSKSLAETNCPVIENVVTEELDYDDPWGNAYLSFVNASEDAVAVTVISRGYNGTMDEWQLVLKGPNAGMHKQGDDIIRTSRQTRPGVWRKRIKSGLTLCWD